MSEQDKRRTLYSSEHHICYLSSTGLFPCVHSLFKNISMHEAFFVFVLQMTIPVHVALQ